MKSSEVYKVTDKYGKRQENIYLLYKIRKWLQNVRNSLKKLEVEYCQMTVEIRNQKENMWGYASYGKWQDVMTSDRKLWYGKRFLKWQVNMASDRKIFTIYTKFGNDGKIRQSAKEAWGWILHNDRILETEMKHMRYCKKRKTPGCFWKVTLKNEIERCFSSDM